MDPVGGAASLITLIALSKTIVQTCRKYIKDVRGAPAILAQFCDELEALTVLFDNFLVLENAIQNVPSGRPSVLAEVLRRTNLLEQYQSQLRLLEEVFKKVDMKNVGQRLLFPLRERQILDCFGVVQKVRSILQSAVQLDNTFVTQSVYKEMQKLGTTWQTSHNAILLDFARLELNVKEQNAMLHKGFSQVQPTSTPDMVRYQGQEQLVIFLGSRA